MIYVEWFFLSMLLFIYRLIQENVLFEQALKILLEGEKA